MSRHLPGDILVRRKGPVLHHGIALGDGRVLHNTPWRGEHITSESEFSAGKRVYARHLERDARRRALAHAERGQREGYNLFTNNCEHTVFRATTGAADSPQLRGIVAGIAAGAMVFGLTRHPGAALASFAAVRGWLGRR
jgi:hypothetical protein